MKHFITPTELNAQGHDYICLDIRGPKAYEAGHLPHAFVLDVTSDLSGVVGPHGGRHPLPDFDTLAAKLASFGITPQSKIVIYDSWLFLAGRLWWTLRYMGFTHVKVLAGGIERWTREGFPLTQTSPPLPATPTPFHYTLQSHMVMTRDEVLQSSNSQSHVIIDARAPERYAGTDIDTMDGMTGHIPTAINHFWADGFDANGPLPTDQLKKLFADVSATTKPIVTYCGSGITACLTMLTMSEVGIESTLYVGSSSDWVTYPNFPIKTGVEILK